jgi:phosphonopyruvate decarboxylase
MSQEIKLSKIIKANKDFRFTGVPCSLLRTIVEPLSFIDTSEYLIAANEGDAVAIASGFYLGGKNGVVTMQNSGLGNAVNPLTSLNSTFEIPVAMLISMRGSFNSYPEEPQHIHMGEITEKLLKLLNINIFCQDENINDNFNNWCRHIPKAKESSAFLIYRNDVPVETKKDNSFNHPLNSKVSCYLPGVSGIENIDNRAVNTRAQLMEFLLSIISIEDIIVSTTGYTSRELNTISDRNLNFYMVGSMGCASSIGLGISMVSNRRVFIFDGDGAALMRMGALSTIGLVNPPNLIHIMIDNGIHESTGGQQTATSKTNLAGIAISCGYQKVLATSSLAELESVIKEYHNGSLFVHFKVKPGVLANLGRPSITPIENTIRFRENCT